MRIGLGIWRGERVLRLRLVVFMFAFGGLVGLMLPGLSAPPLYGSILMLAAGVAWGVYSLRGKGAGDPTKVTAGDFLPAPPSSPALPGVLFTETLLPSHSFWYALGAG